jgi:hypothetical protein
MTTPCGLRRRCWPPSRRRGDAIWKQVVPDRAEMADADAEDDPLEEDLMSPVPHLVHRYPDRVLLDGHQPVPDLLPVLHS